MPSPTSEHPHNVIIHTTSELAFPCCLSFLTNTQGSQRNPFEIMITNTSTKMQRLNIDTNQVKQIEHAQKSASVDNGSVLVDDMIDDEGNPKVVGDVCYQKGHHPV